MKYTLAIAAFCLSSLPAFAADAPAPAAMDKAICVRASRDTDYNARPIAQHDVFIQNSVGDRRGLRLATTCIHIYRDAFVAVHSLTSCVHMGDDIAVRTIDGRGERCKIAKVTPFVEGSIEAPYK